MTNTDQILDQIQAIIWKIDGETKSNYLVRENMEKEVPLDSLDRLSLLTDLEEVYQIEIDMEEAEKLDLRFPDNLLRYLDERTANKK